MSCHLATACETDTIVNLFVLGTGFVFVEMFVSEILMVFVNLFAMGSCTRCSVQGVVVFPQHFSVCAVWVRAQDVRSVSAGCVQRVRSVACVCACVACECTM